MHHDETADFCLIRGDSSRNEVGQIYPSEGRMKQKTKKKTKISSFKNLAGKL